MHSFVATAAATRVDNIDSGPFQCLLFVFFGFFLFSFCLFACLFYFFLIVFNLVVSFWQKEIQVITGKISFFPKDNNNRISKKTNFGEKLKKGWPDVRQVKREVLSHLSLHEEYSPYWQLAPYRPPMHTH